MQEHFTPSACGTRTMYAYTFLSCGEALHQLGTSVFNCCGIIHTGTEECCTQSAHHNEMRSQ